MLFKYLLHPIPVACMWLIFVVLNLVFSLNMYGLRHRCLQNTRAIRSVFFAQMLAITPSLVLMPALWVSLLHSPTNRLYMYVYTYRIWVDGVLVFFCFLGFMLVFSLRALITWEPLFKEFSAWVSCFLTQISSTIALGVYTAAAPSF